MAENLKAYVKTSAFLESHTLLSLLSGFDTEGTKCHVERAKPTGNQKTLPKEARAEHYFPAIPQGSFLLEVLLMLLFVKSETKLT